MSHTRVLSFALLMLAGFGSRAPAQATRGAETTGPPQPDVRDFIEKARAASARYREHDAAIADGYRLIGGDFPGMGEHWINLGLLMGAQIDPSQPQIVSYAPIGGERKLIGVAFALPVEEGGSPPDYPIGAQAWHFHGASVEEESFGGVQSTHSTEAAGVRVAVLHAWIWLENPAGIFARDNWALPFARLGLVSPEEAAPAAARALSLLSGGDRYYANVVASCGAKDLATMEIDALIGAKRDAVNEWMRSARTDRSLDADEIGHLANVWLELSREVEATAGCSLP